MSSIHHKHLLPLGSRLPQSRSSENLPPPPEKTCNPRRIYRNPTKTKRTSLHPPLQASRESQPLLPKACESCRRPTTWSPVTCTCHKPNVAPGAVPANQRAIRQPSRQSPPPRPGPRPAPDQQTRVPVPAQAGTAALLPCVELISDFMHCCMMLSGLKLLKQGLRRSSMKLKYRK